MIKKEFQIMSSKENFDTQAKKETLIGRDLYRMWLFGAFLSKPVEPSGLESSMDYKFRIKE